MAAVLLPPNATPLERNIEQSMAFYGDEREVLVGQTWRPHQCPVEVLPFLAWGLRVRRWDATWPEETRRRVVADAIAVHKIRGTTAAVEAALDDIGAVYDIEIRPGGAAFRMTVSVYNSATLLGETNTATLREYIDDVKRFSVHYDLGLAASLDCSFVFLAVGVGGVQIGDFVLQVDVEPVAAPNQGPVASAGANQAVAAGARITLDGSGSADPDGSIASYAWVQTAGDAVVLDDADTATPEFDAPSTSAEQTLVFRLTVTDGDGAMATDDVDVVVAAFVPPTPVSYRFNTIEALREFATFVEGDGDGRWAIIQSGSTGSGGTGPGENSAGPYAATDSSGSLLTVAIENSVFDLDVEMTWPAPTGRVLRLECAVMGEFEEAGEGLMVQGMAAGGQWEDIALVRGWSYSETYTQGSDITDYGGATIACTRDGGWATFDVAIPDAHEQVRLRLVASGGAVFRHDVALWSAELRNA